MDNQRAYPCNHTARHVRPADTIRIVGVACGLRRMVFRNTQPMPASTMPNTVAAARYRNWCIFSVSSLGCALAIARAQKTDVGWEVAQ